MVDSATASHLGKSLIVGDDTLFLLSNICAEMHFPNFRFPTVRKFPFF
jgi:hypothetical protein